MASDWIKIEKSTPDKPEVEAMALALGIGADAVLGKLIRVWSWFDTNCADGDARSVTVSLLDRIALHPGFADAMQGAGWLTLLDDGFHMVNFERHNGKNAKRRALTQRRMESHRSGRDARVTHAASQNRHQSKSKSKKKKPPTPLKPKPADWAEASKYLSEESMASVVLRDAWCRWATYRAEAKKALTASTVKLQIRKLEGWGVRRAVAAIDHTIERGWAGLREPDPKDAQDDPGWFARDKAKAL